MINLQKNRATDSGGMSRWSDFKADTMPVTAFWLMCDTPSAYIKKSAHIPIKCTIFVRFFNLRPVL
jgi:hypothetical protein